MSYQKRIQELESRAKSFSSRGDFEDAIKVLTELIHFFPYPRAIIKRALCYLDMMDSNESYTETQTRSLLFKAKEDLSKAIELYRVMSKETYEQFDGDNNVSFCFSERGRINFLLGAVYKNSDANSDENQGVAWLDFLEKDLKADMQLLQQAVDDANESIKYDSNNIEAYRLKGEIYAFYYDDPNVAIDNCSKVISINATSSDYVMRAWCNYLVDDLRKAYSDYQRAANLGLHEYDVESLSRRAWLNGKGQLWTDFLDEVK